MVRGSVWLVVAACSGTPAPTTPAVTAKPADEASLAPTAIACRLEGKWDYEQPHDLRFRAGDKPFASVGHTDHAVLALTTTGAYVELSTDVIKIGGMVPGEAVILHPAKPFLVADYLIPGAGAILRWRGANPGTVSFELELGPHIKPVVPPRATRSCGDLALESASDLDPQELVEGPRLGFAMLPNNQAIPLSIEPGAPPVAELRYADDAPRVDILERRGDDARVIVLVSSLDPRNDVTVVGWVSAALLDSRMSGFGGTWATGGDRGAVRGRRLRGTQLVRCAHEVPLIAELGHERHVVGAIAANVVIDVLPDQQGNDFPAVTIRAASVQLAEGARFLVKRTALADCTEARD